MNLTARDFDGRSHVASASGKPGGDSRPRPNGPPRGPSAEGRAGKRALRRTEGRLRRRPLALGLRLAAALEGLAALHAREARAEKGAVTDPDGWDTVRLTTGASLLAAVGRPHLRVGALVTATLGHALRTLALIFEPGARRRKQRLAVELAMSAALGGLLRQAGRAARWER
jgi:hypothetical protein